MYNRWKDRGGFFVNNKKRIAQISLIGAGVGALYWLFHNRPAENKLALEHVESDASTQSLHLGMNDGMAVALTITRPEGTPKGIVQVIHGVTEHRQRYQDFADFLAANGYVVVTSDNRGHGDSIYPQNPLGHMPSVERLVEDQYEITRYMKNQYPELPLTLFGHSFGSLLARNYLALHDDELAKLVLTGTINYKKAAPVGDVFAKMALKTTGEQGRAWILKKLSGFDSKDNTWLTHDEEQLEKALNDPKILEGYSNQGIQTIWQADANLKDFARYECKNPDLPILSLTGEEDVKMTGGKKGLKDTQETLEKIGYHDLEFVDLPNMRHEVLNEVENQLVYAKILDFIDEA